MKKQLFYTILFLLIATYSVAQRPYVKHYGIDDGLAQSQVLSICIDSKERIWAGTNNGGVSVYDGVKFINYTVEDGLVNNRVYSLFKASNDNIIIGTQEGISIFDGVKFTPYYDTINDFNLSVRSIKENINGEIILATDKGLLKFIDGTYSRYHIDSLVDDIGIFDLCFARDGTTWLASSLHGVFSIKDNNVINYTEEDGLKYNGTKSIIQDSLGNIWVGTARGITKINTKNEIITDNSGQSYNASLLDRNNGVYFLSEQGWFVNYSTDNTNTIQKDYKIEFSELTARCGVQDYEGNFWIGSDVGIVVFNKKSRFIEYNNLSNNENQNVYALYFSDDNMLHYNISLEKTFVINVDTHNIKKTKEKFITKYYFNNDLGGNNIISNRLWDIDRDYDGNIWFVSWGGMSRLDTSGNFHNYGRIKIKKDSKYYSSNNYTSVDGLSPYINDILVAKDSSIYFAAYNGLNKYKHGKFINLEEKFPILNETTIYSLMQDKSGRVWGATKKGYFILSGDSIRFFNKENGFADIKVNSIIEDDNGNYWLSTGEGLFHFNRKEYKKYTLKDGLTSSNIYVLEIDNFNNLIIGTDKGFDKLDLNEYYNNGILKISRNGKDEGFSGVECNLNAIYKDYRGHIWFGTVKGVMEYIPENDLPNLVEPNTFITEFTLTENDKLYAFVDSLNYNSADAFEIELPYKFKNLNFKFIGTSKMTPSKVRFQYKLNINDDWIDVKNSNEVDIPFLPDGDYTLYVRASNDNGIWDSTPAELSFIVETPIWKQTWFFITIVILILILIVVLIKFREKQLVKEKEVLEIKVAERTQEIVKQKEIVEEKNKDITDSINYAKNIQEALLPNDEFLEGKLKSSIIFFRPRDIVSGDFYWMTNRNGRTFISAADSTGHGVPGAFMSMLGMAFLDEIVNNDNSINASQVLNKMRSNVISALKQKGKSGEARDGMDMSLCIIDWDNNKIEFAGANNPLYLISADKDKVTLVNGEEERILEPVMIGDNEYNLFEIKADKMPIGFYVKTDDFTNHTIELKTGDTFYMFSDGFADQFGGEKGKKFKYKKFKKLLLDLETIEPSERRNVLEKTFLDWIDGFEQIDDVIVLGLKL